MVNKNKPQMRETKRLFGTKVVLYGAFIPINQAYLWLGKTTSQCFLLCDVLEKPIPNKMWSPNPSSSGTLYRLDGPCFHQAFFYQVELS